MLTLHIPIENLVPEISKTPSKIIRLRNVGIDYSTNTIDATLDGSYISIFYFSDYDMDLNNRGVDYKISWGETGITIQFVSTKNVSNRKTHLEQLEL